MIKDLITDVLFNFGPTWPEVRYAQQHYRQGGSKGCPEQVIAKCGNSGYTSQPHIHFHLNDCESFFASAGLPIRFVDVWVKDNDNFSPAGYIVKARFVQNSQS